MMSYRYFKKATMPKQTKFESVFCSLRAVRHYSRGEPWNLTQDDFNEFVRTANLIQIIGVIYASGGFCRIDETLPWQAGNLAFDANLIQRKPRATPSELSGATSKCILTKEQWVMQLQLDAMRAQRN
ncbi:hypothetical protein ASF29_23445 [Rhizobium sp. Leaf262]|nr:hypothetical protein ASF29_23445 [Rhizobium sp. Leaf262]